MDFSEFKERLKDDIAERLYDRGNEVSVTEHSVNKLNQSYESITVTPEGSKVGVNINADRIYDAVVNGERYEDLLAKTIETIERGIEGTPNIDVNTLTDYTKMKERLVMEVVSIEVNKEMLETIPHKVMEDMAIVYRFDLGGDKDNRATVLVTNQLIESMGITADQLHNDAMENAPNLRPVVIQGMSEVIAEMSGLSKEDMIEMGMASGNGAEMMYVASSSDKISGAGVIAYEDFMSQAAERVGGDFFILPSSRHEVLLVPDDGFKTLPELEAMVREVNSSEVSPEDKLTDSVYHYDSKNKIFELGEKFVSRMQEKESVLDNIKEKKKEIAAKEPKKDDIAKSAAKTKGGEAI